MWLLKDKQTCKQTHTLFGKQLQETRHMYGLIKRLTLLVKGFLFFVLEVHSFVTCQLKATKITLGTIGTTSHHK